MNLPQDLAQGDILVAAAQCFTELGYQGASIDDVAHRLGATKGRIYHHYRSKADLFAAVFRTGMAMNHRAIAPCMALPGPATARLAAMAKAHTSNMIATRAFQRAVWEGVTMQLRGATTPEQRAALIELQEDRDRYSDKFRDAVIAARAELAMPERPIGIAMQMMFLALNSPIFWYSPRPTETSQDLAGLVDEIVRFALRGLGFEGDFIP